MKVEHSNVDKLIQNRSDATNAVDRKQQEAQNASLDGRRKDEAALSEKAQTLARARTHLDEVSEVRENKVAALKEKVQAGEYEVDVNKLANRIEDLFKPE
ncbi:MAG: flagellar biosynthesis anti-sigma factor FlgM [Anaerolineales bacterium]|nr:flagellar biosynthesis anti-sigma factor FlgM [Anaerolineales bacterium]